MRILYGVCGEGMGHASRSLVLAEHLRSRGHDLRLVCQAGRAFDALHQAFPDRVYDVAGLDTVIFKNRVDPALTVCWNAAKQFVLSPWCHLSLAARIAPVPDVVLSDFEPFTARYAKLLQLPLFAVDNIHFLTRCQLPERMAPSWIMRTAVENMVPGADHYFVLTLAWAPLRAPQTTLHAPVVRPEVIAALPHRARGDHLVAYFNDRSDVEDRLRVLLEAGVPTHLYGADPSLSRGPVECRRADRAAFARDLASCRGVVGGAGFTLLSEAFALGKPVFAVPFAGQGEQLSNARYVEALGWGQSGERFDARGVRDFAKVAVAYERKVLSDRRGPPSNEELFASVDRAIGQAA